MIICIDGVGGAGKSTLAFYLAKTLGCAFLPSGMLYRFVAWRQSLVGLDQALQESQTLSFPLDQDQPQVLFEKQNLIPILMQTEVAKAASFVIGNQPSIRQRLLPVQRAFARENLVTEGRDMASVVFPDCDLSIYLIASLVVRAARRLKQVNQSSLAHAKEALRQRDVQDQGRDIAPLCIAHSQHVIDTSSVSVEQVIELMRRMVNASRS